MREGINLILISCIKQTIIVCQSILNHKQGAAQNSLSLLLWWPSSTLNFTVSLSSRASFRNQCSIQSLEATQVILSVSSFQFSISQNTRCLQIYASSVLPSLGSPFLIFCISYRHHVTSFLVISFSRAAFSNSRTALSFNSFSFKSIIFRMSLNYFEISCRIQLLSDSISFLLSQILVSASLISLIESSNARMLASLSRLISGSSELLGFTEWVLWVVLPYKQFTHSSLCSSMQYNVTKFKCFKHFCGSQCSQQAVYKPIAVLQFYFFAFKPFIYQVQSLFKRIEALVGDLSSWQLRLGTGELPTKIFFRPGPSIQYQIIIISTSYVVSQSTPTHKLVCFFLPEARTMVITTALVMGWCRGWLLFFLHICFLLPLIIGSFRQLPVFLVVGFHAGQGFKKIFRLPLQVCIFRVNLYFAILDRDKNTQILETTFTSNEVQMSMFGQLLLMTLTSNVIYRTTDWRWGQVKTAQLDPFLNSIALKNMQLELQEIMMLNYQLVRNGQSLATTYPRVGFFLITFISKVAKSSIVISLTSSSPSSTRHYTLSAGRHSICSLTQFCRSGEKFKTKLLIFWSSHSKYSCKLPIGIFLAIKSSSGFKSKNQIDRVSPSLIEGLNICFEKKADSFVGQVPRQLLIQFGLLYSGCWSSILKAQCKVKTRILWQSYGTILATPSFLSLSAI